MIKKVEKQLCAICKKEYFKCSLTPGWYCSEPVNIKHF